MWKFCAGFSILCGFVSSGSSFLMSREGVLYGITVKPTASVILLPIYRRIC